MHRRDLLLCLAALAASNITPRAAFGTTQRPLGLQLYTVMPMLEQDFDAALASVARIGYTEVETIGSFGRDPAYVRDMFEKHKLVSPSQHMVPGDLYEVFKKLTRGEMTFDAASKHWREVMSIERVQPIMEECIARAQALGQKYIVWQILWPEQMATRALLEKFCKALNQAGELCAQAGLVLNFHNHAPEFEPHDGVIPYDFILANTDPNWVKLELDMYWAVRAGADPQAYFKRHPGRYLQCHLKDGTAAGDITVVGQGMVKFAPLIEAARTAGIEHFYVEQDGAKDPLQASTQAYHYLRRFFQ